MKTTIKLPAADLRNETQGTFRARIDGICRSKADAQRIVSAINETIQEALLQGHAILLINVGTLSVKQKKARAGGRNPQTGEEFIISARKVVTLGSHPVAGRKARLYLHEQVKAKLPDIDAPVIVGAIKRFIDFVALVKQGDRRVEFRGLGVFYPVLKPTCLVRNPSTGETVQAKEKVQIKFRCSERLFKQLNN